MRSRNVRTLADLKVHLLLAILSFGTVPSVDGQITSETETAEVSAEVRPQNKKRNPKLWKWTKEAKHLNSVVGIQVDRSTATGVVIRVSSDVTKANGFECYILTAYHVVEARKSCLLYTSPSPRDS